MIRIVGTLAFKAKIAKTDFVLHPLKSDAKSIEYTSLWSLPRKIRSGTTEIIPSSWPKEGVPVKSLRFLHLVVLLALAVCLGCNNKNATSNNPTDNSAAGNAGASNGASGTPQAGTANGGTPAEQQAQAPKPIVIPAGRAITIRLGEALSSNHSQEGQSFSGTVGEPVQVDGETVIARGATAHGTVVAAKAMGHFKGGALLTLRLDSVTIKGERRAVDAREWSQALKGKGKRSTVAIAGGAGLGAALGGIFGGGKGAAIGAAAGAGAGTAGAAYTGNKEIELPVESSLRFTLRRSIEVR